jgi:hypothetical protein
MLANKYNWKRNMLINRYFETIFKHAFDWLY